MAGLALPLSLFAAAGAYLAVGVLVRPIEAEAPTILTASAIFFATPIGLLLGLAANRLHAERDPFRPENRLWIAVVLGTLFGGAWTGAILGFALRGELVPKWLGAGVIAALVLAPLAIVVVGAALRAERARLGSIVAETDRREVWSVLATGLALASVPSVFGLGAFSDGARTSPPLAPAIALACVIVVARAMILDDRAAARARALLGRAGLEARDHDDDLRLAGARVDLGLGDDVLAEVGMRGAYRHAERACLVVVGSSAETTSALLRARRRGLALFALSAACLASHAAPLTDRGKLAYDELRCDRDHDEHCDHVAREALSQNEIDANLVGLLAAACDRGYPTSCRAASRALDRPARRWVVQRAADALVRACELGDADSCERAALYSLDHPAQLPSQEPVTRAARWAGFACEHGRTSACTGAGILGVGAKQLWASAESAVACYRGDVEACGETYSDRGAVAMLERGCSLGKMVLCYRAAFALSRSEPPAPDLRVEPLYRRACDGGNPFACCDAAWLETFGEVEDRAPARRMLERAREAPFLERGACDAVEDALRERVGG